MIFRVNDMHGNWISGINFIDEWSLGVFKKSTKRRNNNKVRNTYFLLPLLLGLMGCTFYIMIKNILDTNFIFLFTE